PPIQPLVSPPAMGAKHRRRFDPGEGPRGRRRFTHPDPAVPVGPGPARAHAARPRWYADCRDSVDLLERESPMNTFLHRLPAVLALAGLAAGCLPRSSGELMSGGFTYFCNGDDDLACEDQLFDADQVPPAIAVGAHFELAYEPDVSLFDSSPSASSL